MTVLDAVFAPQGRKLALEERAAAARAFLLAPIAFAPGGRALLVPAAAIVGVAAYFALPAEPPALVSIAAAVAAAALLVASWLRGPGNAFGLAFLLIAMSLAGFARIDHRAHQVDAPRAPESGRAIEIGGWVERIDGGDGARRRYVIRVHVAEGLDEAATPLRVRVSGGVGAAHLGDAVAVRAVLRPPPGPSAPDAYDFARSAYFQRLGGVGYAISAFSPAEGIETRGLQTVERALARLRGRLAERLRASAGPRAGPIVAALVTGDRSEISFEDAEALRAGGLGHVLAISGLHMALIGGGVFFALAFALARIEPLARRTNVRKLAAAGALIAAFVYLGVSGAGVSAQRAFVMSAVAFCAILADRRALSLRNVALAAVIVLALAPESALSPGFQMSFAAAAALVATNDHARRRKIARGREPVVLGPAALKAKRFAMGVAVTSFVAGSATAPFAAYHFNRIAPYGFAANLVAMPIFTLLVMPAAALAGLLAPFGLDWPFARLAGLGVEAVLWVAYRAEAMEGALAPIAAGPPAAAALAAAAIVAACVLKAGHVRVGAALALASLIMWRAPAPPDLWIGAGGSVAAYSEGLDGEPRVIAEMRRGDRYGAELFARRAGVEGAHARAPPLATLWRCDDRGCAGVLAGRRVVVAFTAAALGEDCARADLVVLMARAPPRTRARCAAALIDATERRARALWLSGPQIRLQAAARPGRPWSPAR